MTGTMQMGTGIEQPWVMGPNNSHLIDNLALNGGLVRMPAVERAFETARNAIEAVLAKPFIQEEKLRLSLEERDRVFATVEAELNKEATTQRTAFDREANQVLSAARDDLIHAPGIAPSSEDEHKQTRRVMRGVMYATYALADQEVIRGLDIDALEDFGDNVLVAGRGEYHPAGIPGACAASRRIGSAGTAREPKRHRPEKVSDHCSTPRR